MRPAVNFLSRHAPRDKHRVPAVTVTDENTCVFRVACVVLADKEEHCFLGGHLLFLVHCIRLPSARRVNRETEVGTCRWRNTQWRGTFLSSRTQSGFFPNPLQVVQGRCRHGSPLTFSRASLPCSLLTSPLNLSQIPVHKGASLCEHSGKSRHARALCQVAQCEVKWERCTRTTEV